MDTRDGAPLPKADWYADPAGRHQYRYWDGTAWTAHVADSGAQGLDPLETGPPPARLDGPQSTEALIAALQDGDLEPQKRAAQALGASHSPDAVEPLLRCLDADSQTLRIKAMESLVMTEAAEDPLVAALCQRGAHPRYRPIDTLADAVHFGTIKSVPRCARIIKRALRSCWGSFEAGILLGLLQETGDPVGAQLSRAIDANDTVAVDRIRTTF